jgi:hypothetical protein
VIEKSIMATVSSGPARTVRAVSRTPQLQKKTNQQPISKDFKAFQTEKLKRPTRGSLVLRELKTNLPCPPNLNPAACAPRLRPPHPQSATGVGQARRLLLVFCAEVLTGGFIDG